MIYHIATESDWQHALRAGSYTTSTRGRTLAEQGFVHASDADQVTPVANAFYTGMTEPLVVLVIDAARLSAPLRYEQVPGSARPFPHIYGPLNLDAVTAVIPLVPGPDGGYAFEPPR